MYLPSAPAGVSVCGRTMASYECPAGHELALVDAFRDFLFRPEVFCNQCGRWVTPKKPSEDTPTDTLSE